MTGLLEGCFEAEEVVNAVLELWKPAKDNGLKVEGELDGDVDGVEVNVELDAELELELESELKPELWIVLVSGELEGVRAEPALLALEDEDMLVNIEELLLELLLEL